MKNSSVQAVRTTAVSASTHNQTDASEQLLELKTRIGDRLNRLSVTLMARVAERLVSHPDPANDDLDAKLQARISFLGHLAAGLAIAPEELLPASGAGYGSTVTVEDLQTRQQSTYLLMVGSLVDIDAGQVSLASPIGQALLGRSIGEMISVALPQRELRLRILEVVTLSAALDSLESFQE